ncbi:MAG: hypothetical protein VW446_02720 [Alphaproteobacteria bacterium]
MRDGGIYPGPLGAPGDVVRAVVKIAVSGLETGKGTQRVDRRLLERVFDHCLQAHIDQIRARLRCQIGIGRRQRDSVLRLRSGIVIIAARERARLLGPDPAGTKKQEQRQKRRWQSAATLRGWPRVHLGVIGVPRRTARGNSSISAFRVSAFRVSATVHVRAPRTFFGM